MEYLIGAGLAVVVCALAALAGFDRDRVFYPTLLTVIASYYILFAVMGSSTPALAWESLIAGAFLALAVAGLYDQGDPANCCSGETVNNDPNGVCKDIV